jgi:hypothetical protein
MIWRVKTGPKGMASTGRLARVLFTVVAGCGNVSAQGIKPDADAYPAGVQKVLQSARGECKAEGFILHGGYCERAPNPSCLKALPVMVAHRCLWASRRRLITP